MKENADKKRVRDLETMGIIALAVFIIFFIVRFKSQLFSEGEFQFSILRENTLFICGVIILAAGLASRKLSALIADYWLKFSNILGFFTNRIILSIIFFLFLTPMALLYRLFASNPLQLNMKMIEDSMYKEKNYTFKKSDFEKMW